jgi:hypothetical protein
MKYRAEDQRGKDLINPTVHTQEMFCFEVLMYHKDAKYHHQIKSTNEDRSKATHSMRCYKGLDTEGSAKSCKLLSSLSGSHIFHNGKTATFPPN